MLAVTLKHSNPGSGLAVTAPFCPLALRPWQKCLAAVSCQILIWVLQQEPERETKKNQLNWTLRNLFSEMPHRFICVMNNES